MIELLEISVEEIVLEIFQQDNVLLEYNQLPMLLIATLPSARAVDLTMVAWGSVTDKPTLFTPEAHNQAWSTITATPNIFPSDWTLITGKPDILEDSEIIDGGNF